MNDWILGASIWLVGASFTTGALITMGERSPTTYDDSYSGDDTLDNICIVLWPIFWPCWAVFQFGRWLASAKSTGDAND